MRERVLRFNHILDSTPLNAKRFNGSSRLQEFPVSCSSFSTSLSKSALHLRTEYTEHAECVKKMQYKYYSMPEIADAAKEFACFKIIKQQQDRINMAYIYLLHVFKGYVWKIFNVKLRLVGSSFLLTGKYMVLRNILSELKASLENKFIYVASHFDKWKSVFHWLPKGVKDGRYCLSGKHMLTFRIDYFAGISRRLSLINFIRKYLDYSKVKLPKSVPSDIFCTSKWKNFELKLVEKYDSKIITVINKNAELQAELYVFGDREKLEEANDFVTDFLSTTQFFYSLPLISKQYDFLKLCGVDLLNNARLSFHVTVTITHKLSSWRSFK